MNGNESRQLVKKEKLLIANGHLEDPSVDLATEGDLLIDGGVIVAYKPQGQTWQTGADLSHEEAERISSEAQRVEAKNLLIWPGLNDCSANLLLPDISDHDLLSSEMQAAAAGGFANALALPPVENAPDAPPINVADVIRLRETARLEKAVTRIHPVPPLTLNGGLADLGTMRDHGCIATSSMVGQGDVCLERNAARYAHEFGLKLICNCFEASFARGVAHKGETASRLGLLSNDPLAEVLEVVRWGKIAQKEGMPIHFSRISTADSIQEIRRMRQDGLDLTADIPIHNLLWDENKLDEYSSQFLLTPPLRTSRDRETLLAAIEDGFCAISSNHKAVSAESVTKPFGLSKPGPSIFETFIPLLLQLIESKALSRTRAIAAVTSIPQKIFALPSGSLRPGNFADIVLIDPRQQWTPDVTQQISKGARCLEENQPLQGKGVGTLCRGEWGYQADDQ